MDKASMMNQEIIKEALFRHGQSGGITSDALKAELKDIPEEEISTSAPSFSTALTKA